MPPTKQTARSESSATSGPTPPLASSDVRVLAEVPWLGQAAVASGGVSQPQFSLAPQSVIATADESLHTAIASPRTAWRVDAPQANVVRPASVRFQEARLPAPAIDTIVVRPTIEPAVEKTVAPSAWSDSLLLLHGAALPYLRVLLLVAALAVAGCVLLVLRGLHGTPKAAPPHEFLPLAIDSPAPAPLQAIEPITPRIVALPPLEQPASPQRELQPIGRRPEASGPGTIARRQSIPATPAPGISVSSPYPSTAAPAALPPLATEITPAQPAMAEAQFADRIFPLTEQARHDDHQSSVH